jgi:cytochrome c oxidase subunit 2
MNYFINNYLFFNVNLRSSYSQINFQDPATPIAQRIIEIHHHVFYFLVLVLVFVAWMLYRILYTFTILENKRFSATDLKFLYSLSRLRFLHNTTIEVIWTCIPSLILVAIAIPSFGLLYAMDDVIDPEITLKIIGHQWYWSYEYSDYQSEYGDISFDSYMLPEQDLNYNQFRLLDVDNYVVLPLGVYIRLNITAADVLHSWAVPSLGIKIDAVPHRINSGIVFLERLGIFYGQCSEICGVNHGFMPIAVKSVQIKNYLNWLQNKINN